MKNRSIENIWWALPGQPSIFANALAESLEQGFAVLRLEDCIPWPGELWDTISARLSLPVRQLMWKPGALSAGDFLLSTLFSPRERACYFPDRSYGTYIAQLRADAAIICISGVHTAAEIQDWSELLRDYHQAGTGQLKFVVEYDGPGVPVPMLQHRFRTNQLRSFSLLLSSVLNNTTLPSYQAELAFQLSNRNPELCSELLLLGNELLQNPEPAGQRFGIDSGRISSACHQAVLASTFPLIESTRFRFIQQHSSTLAECLPIRNVDGELIDNPSDLEIGQISYLLRNRDALRNLDHAEQVHLCAAVRNLIAHNRPVAYETLVVLSADI